MAEQQNSAGTAKHGRGRPHGTTRLTVEERFEAWVRMRFALADLAMRAREPDFFRATNAELWEKILKRRANEPGHRATAARMVAGQMRHKRKIAPRTVERYYDNIENDVTLAPRRDAVIDTMALAHPHDWRERRKQLLANPIVIRIERRAIWPEEK